jgi:hypothetical protein
VFVVWEPILLTDIVRPTTRVLARVADARAAQVWDPRQVIAKYLKQSAAAPQMKPECCDNEGIWWDLIAVYAPGAVWEERIPAAAFLNGPVIRVAGQASDVIGRLAGRGATAEARGREVAAIFDSLAVPARRRTSR